LDTQLTALFHKKIIVANSKGLKTGCILFAAVGGDYIKFKIQWLACPTLKILDYSHGEQNIK
jgi:hypothetical protein